VSENSRNLPNADRLSVLAAVLFLAYALAHFVTLPEADLEVQLPGFFLEAEITIRTLISLLAAGLTASGADWLLRDHPALQQRKTLPHWLLPSLTAWVVGLSLFQLPFGLAWWIVFGFGGALLMIVLVAEYIVVDPDDARYLPAAAVLTAVSFALFVMLAIVLKIAEVRLYMIIPSLGLAAGLVSLRTFHLRSQGDWKFLDSAVITIIVVQVAAGLHYWPISPIGFGLGVLGPAYGLVSLLSRLSEGETLRQALVEPGLVLAVTWGALFWLR
jgi:hypothetical protein